MTLNHGHHHGDGLFQHDLNSPSDFGTNVLSAQSDLPSGTHTGQRSTAPSQVSTSAADLIQSGSSSGASGTVVQTTGQSGDGFVIIPTYDSSITSIESSDPTLYNEFTGAVNTAIDYYESLITNSMTIDITFGLGDISGAGQNSTSNGLYNYGTFYSELKNALDAPGATALQKAAFADLPTSDPTHGSGMFYVTDAEQEALGLTSTPATGDVLLSNDLPYSWTQPNTNGNNYDAVGALEHEISEVMGRQDLLGSTYNGSPPSYSLLDFFHYSAAGDASNASFGSPPGTLEEPFESSYSTSVQTYFLNPLTGLITLPYDSYQDGDVADWKYTVDNDSYGGAFNGATESVSPTDLAEMNLLGYDFVACYVQGTFIATIEGERPIEHLNIGDRVITLSGGEMPIRWIGRRRYSGWNAAGNREVLPVTISAGALGGGLPRRDLRVSPEHAMYIDGVLIAARDLLNGKSIIQEESVDELTYFHLEFDTHAVIFAEGAPSESFVDDESRAMFDNAAEFHRMFPNSRPTAASFCAPRIEDGWQLEQIRQALAKRPQNELGRSDQHVFEV